MRLSVRSLTLSALAAALPLALVAQTPAEIHARYNRAVDPEGKAASIQGMKTTLTMEIAAAGIRASITSVQARPALMVLNIDIPQLGVMRQGYDGTTAWASDPMQGPRIMTGSEATAFVDESDMRGLLRTMELFSAVDPAGEVTVDGDRALCLKLTWKSGRETTECYSTTTGLITESRAKQEAQGSVIDAVTHYQDYRLVSGFMMPHRVVQNMMGMQQVMTLVSVEFGPQPASVFELPPEIKALKP